MKIAIEDPLSLAFEKMDREEYKEAIEYFELELSKISEKDPYRVNKQIYLYGFIGECYFFMESYDDAIVNFEKGYKLYPGHSRANVFYVVALAQEKGIGVADMILKETKTFLSRRKNYEDYGIHTDFNLNNSKVIQYNGEDEVNSSSTLYLHSHRFSFVAHLSGVIDELKINWDVLEDEYKYLEVQLTEVGTDPQNLVNAYWGSLDGMFSLVNTYVWHLLEKGKFEESGRIIERYLGFINGCNTLVLADQWEMRTKYPADLGSGYTTEGPINYVGYLLGNLINSYAGQKLYDKAAIVYCDMRDGKVRFNEGMNNNLLLAKVGPYDYNGTFEQGLKDGILIDFVDLGIPKNVIDRISSCEGESNWVDILK